VKANACSIGNGRYATLFSDKEAPRTPNYNASAVDLADHHWLIAQQDIITESQAVTIDELFRNRWRTLVSVDDAIAAMVATITDLGLIDSTYFFSTSDHGYQLGQMRLPSCKLNVYENDIRIPMVRKVVRKSVCERVCERVHMKECGWRSAKECT
jgi:N-acetylglucosamine-6-sulfatase